MLVASLIGEVSCRYAIKALTLSISINLITGHNDYLLFWTLQECRTNCQLLPI